jgi:hypothetical protein
VTVHNQIVRWLRRELRCFGEIEESHLQSRLVSADCGDNFDRTGASRQFAIMARSDSIPKSLCFQGCDGMMAESRATAVCCDKVSCALTGWPTASRCSSSTIRTSEEAHLQESHGSQWVQARAHSWSPDTTRKDKNQCTTVSTKEPTSSR